MSSTPRQRRPPPAPDGRPDKPAPRMPAPFALLLFFGALILALTWFGAPSEPEIDYDALLQRVEAGEVARVVIENDRIRAQFHKPVRIGGEGEAADVETGTAFAQFPASSEHEDLRRLLTGHGVGVRYSTGSPLSGVLLTWLLPIGLLVLLWMFFMRSMGRAQSVLGFGRSRARIVPESDVQTTFEDVAGIDEARDELREIVDFLKQPQRYASLGGQIPKGVLLVGPPGCGKTLIARALAGEAGVPFFSISGSDFVEMFVGVGAARVRDLFVQARSRSPCIIFIDEIDAVGRQRGAGIGGGHDEREQTLNQLLVEMDGFETDKGTIIIAATNRPDVLDPALLRPGRFDRRIVIDLPDQRGRRAILEVHARKKPLSDDVDLDEVAKRTPGFSGADLANAMNEAALLAARRGKERIERDDVLEAVERVVAGPERRSRVISEREKVILSYHEMGHALVALRLRHADPVHKVSIIPRGASALGYTLMLPNEDRYILTREDLLDRITGLLGGRAAERVVFRTVSTGAADDLEKASELARRMVLKFGMGDGTGAVSFGRREAEVFLGRDLSYERNFSEETAVRIDEAVRGMIEECMGRAEEILTENRAVLDTLAARVREKEVMDGEEIRVLLAEMDRGTAEERRRVLHPIPEEVGKESPREAG